MKRRTRPAARSLRPYRSSRRCAGIPVISEHSAPQDKLSSAIVSGYHCGERPGNPESLMHRVGVVGSAWPVRPWPISWREMGTTSLFERAATRAGRRGILLRPRARGLARLEFWITFSRCRSRVVRATLSRRADVVNNRYPELSLKFVRTASIVESSSRHSPNW